MSKVLTCTAYDDATATCTQEAWVEQLTVLPTMTPEQATEIGMAVMLLWVPLACAVLIARKAF